MVTNAAGQAAAVGFTPTAAGAIQINVSAAFQGQLATAAITQTNFATAAQAAAAASTGSGGASGATAAGAGAGAGGGISATTIAIVGAAAAGGVVAAQQTGLIGGSGGFIVISGQVYGRGIFGSPASACTGRYEAIGTGSTCYLDPVAGATVSTSLDGATATTDGAGNFDLTTTLPRSRIDECVTYTITITAPGHPTFTVNTRGFSGNQQEGSQHRQLFTLSPPSPTFMSGC